MSVFLKLGRIGTRAGVVRHRKHSGLDSIPASCIWQSIETSKVAEYSLVLQKMAAVASGHMSDNFRAPNSEQFTDSSPSFTAVNGTASPTPAVKPKSSQEMQNDTASEANGRLVRPPSSHQERPKSPTYPRPGQTTGPADQVPSTQPPCSDRTALPSAPAISSATPQRQDKEITEDSKAPYGSSHSRTPSSQQSKTATTSPTKRKRSYSDNYDNANNNAAYHGHGLPSSPERHRIYDLDNARTHEHENISPPTYPPPPDHSQAPELYPRPDRHPLMRNDYEQRVEPNIAPVPNRPYYPDTRMAEALQRENRAYDAMAPHENFVSPEEDEEHHAQQFGEFGASRGSQSGHDMDRKRRKRVFSNRTKTGCMTCRRRKKKCDEQHPECKYETSLPISAVGFQFYRVCRFDFLYMHPPAPPIASASLFNHPSTPPKPWCRILPSLFRNTTFSYY